MKARAQPSSAASSGWMWVSVRKTRRRLPARRRAQWAGDGRNGCYGCGCGGEGEEAAAVEAVHGLDGTGGLLRSGEADMGGVDAVADAR